MANQFDWVETADYGRWDELVEASPQGSIFSKSEFLLSLQRPFRLYLVLERQQPLALLAAVEDGSGRQLVQSAFTPYQGILFVDDAKALARQRVAEQFRLSEFLIAALVARYESVSMAMSCHLDDIRPFLWHNYHHPQLGQFSCQPRYTAILDLDTVEAASYAAQMRACRRQELKKGAACSIDRQADLDQFIDLYIRTFARQEITVPPATVALVRSIASRAIGGGYGQLCSCAANDEVAAMSLFLFDRRRAYYLFAANQPRLRNSGAATRLMYENILEAKRRGLRELDFVGANSPKRADFKLSFNPQLKLYFDLRYRSPDAA